MSKIKITIEFTEEQELQSHNNTIETFEFTDVGVTSKLTEQFVYFIIGYLVKTGHSYFNVIQALYHLSTDLEDLNRIKSTRETCN